MRYTTKEIGDRGEDYAAAYLKQHQCIILDRNYRKRWGEIDIIARQKDTYLFVEVKTRHVNPLGRPYEAVDYRKRRRILKTAITYIREHHLDANYRCDICEVYVDRETLDLHKINYFKNAFVPESDFGYY